MKRSSAALRQRLRKRVSVFHLPSPVDCAHLDNNISNGINGERLGALEPMPAFKPPTSRLDRCLRLGGGSVSWHRANVLCHAGPESTGSRRLLWQSMCTACVRCVVATLVRGGPHNHAASAATCRHTAGASKVDFYHHTTDGSRQRHGCSKACLPVRLLVLMLLAGALLVRSWRVGVAA